MGLVGVRHTFVSVTMGTKPRGIRCARKLVNRRRTQRWADKDYKKANLGTKYKCNPFGGSSHAKGIVVEKIAAFVPRDGCLNFIDENDEVLIAGFGRRGHAVGDIPGVRFKVVKVAGVALLALYREKKEKPRS